MKFPWLSWGDGVKRPILRCSLRHFGKVLPTDLLILLDTGADTTTLPLALAPLLGYQLNDLDNGVRSAVGGRAKTSRPKAPINLDIEIGGLWYALPCVVFADTPLRFLAEISCSAASSSRRRTTRPS